MIPERLQALRAEMTKREIDIYVVPTADFHESEYVGEYFKARAFMTGFTGSAGTAVITQEKAGLWTDGRYFVQAERQLDGSGVTLFRMAEEGVPTVDEYIEKELSNIQLMGIGTNVGCYGSISPTVETLNDLVEIAEHIEERLGRKLEYISGGATSSLMRVWDGNIPERINLLRIGEGILLARDLDVFYGYDMSELYQDVFRLKAEVIEVKDKPSHPVGTIAVDAFGHTPTYVDRGMRRRALLAMGKVDYGDPSELLPLEKGIEVLGASSDHTIIDVEDAEKDWKVGDIMEFDICYATIVYLTNCRNVNIAYV